MFLVDGEKLEKEESCLLAEILRKAGISLTFYGIDIEQLAEGKSNLSYEEIQFVLKDNPNTHVLSGNLKEELKTSESNM